MDKDEVVELFCILALMTLAANLPIWNIIFHHGAII
jgi:hypothetical protein